MILSLLESVFTHLHLEAKMPYTDGDAADYAMTIKEVGGDLAEALRAVNPFAEALSTWDNVPIGDDEELTVTNLLEAGKKLVAEAIRINGTSRKLTLSEREDLSRTIEIWQTVQVPLSEFDDD